MPLDYQNGKIYKIVSFTTDDVYIGSTCEKYLSNRLGGHRKAYKSYLNGKHNYSTSFKLLENDDYDIILVENYPCNNNHELLARERYWIENTENCVNKNIPNRTIKEYRHDNKDKISEYQKEYREDNKDKIKQYQQDNRDKINERKREYYEDNRDKFKEYSKKHNENNKDKINEKQKEYYKDNKDKINEKQNQKYICGECGGKYSTANKAVHLKSKKHIKGKKEEEVEDDDE